MYFGAVTASASAEQEHESEILDKVRVSLAIDLQCRLRAIRLNMLFYASSRVYRGECVERSLRNRDELLPAYTIHELRASVYRINSFTVNLSREPEGIQTVSLSDSRINISSQAGMWNDGATNRRFERWNTYKPLNGYINKISVACR